MNQPESQFDSDPNETYFDPEALDSSEQEFSASLETASRSPDFVVDTSQNSISPTNGAASRTTDHGDEHGTSAESLGDADADQFSGGSSEHSQADSDWRDLVSAKVKHYKTLKPRKERYPSLQLQFDSGPSWKLDEVPRPAVDRASFVAPRADAPPVHEAQPDVRFEVTTEATARVLEFPRPGLLPFNKDELAEPVVDRPRIMEAPELLPPPPALGGILIEPVRGIEPERQPGLDMPLKTAGLARRIFAAATDGVLVAAGLGIFGYVFLRFNSSLPQARTAAEVTVALLGILWLAYQSSFIIFCGTTPGLHAAKLRIAKFDGTAPARKLRRWRALASILSCASLGLGYAWCFFDEDQLSWHDRITKTHLAPRG